jgi:hypothetical protein
MGRFERSERGGGQPDPQEALRRAREAVARERAQRGEGHAAEGEDQRRESELEDVEDAMRQHDEREADG